MRLDDTTQGIDQEGRPNPEETPNYRDHKSEEEVAKEIMEERG